MICRSRISDPGVYVAFDAVSHATPASPMTRSPVATYYQLWPPCGTPLFSKKGVPTDGLHSGKTVRDGLMYYLVDSALTP